MDDHESGYEHEIEDFDEIAQKAATEGDFDTVRRAVAQGAKNFDMIAVYAKIYNHSEIVRWAYDKDIAAIKDPLSRRMWGSTLLTILQFISSGSDDLNSIAKRGTSLFPS